MLIFASMGTTGATAHLAVIDIVKYGLLAVCGVLLIGMLISSRVKGEQMGAALRRYRKGLMVGLCLLVIVGGSLLWYGQTQMPRVNAAGGDAAVCQGSVIRSVAEGVSCQGADPAATRCWSNNAYIVGAVILQATYPFTTPAGTLRLWYSKTCGTNWAQIIGGKDTRQVDRQGNYVGNGANGKNLGDGGCDYRDSEGQIRQITREGSAIRRADMAGYVRQVNPMINDGGVCTEVSPMLYAAFDPVEIVGDINQDITPLIQNKNASVGGNIDQSRSPGVDLMEGDWWY